jgi:phosphatidate cytidylyltransferase
MTDTGAYFIGILFGKNKINPRISPKKTWEGFTGGIIISTLFSFVFAMILALCGHPILKCLDTDNWYLVLIISLIMPLFATLGDFTFSALKRHYEIKDFGNILPGHGGVLDRVDSLIFTATATAIVVSIILSFIYSENYVAIGGNPFL